MFAELPLVALYDKIREITKLPNYPGHHDCLDNISIDTYGINIHTSYCCGEYEYDTTTIPFEILDYSLGDINDWFIIENEKRRKEELERQEKQKKQFEQYLKDREYLEYLRLQEKFK